MTAKILAFKIPERIRHYPDPEDLLIDIDSFEFDISDTLGVIGKMIQEHRFLVLNTLSITDYTKPYREWTGITKHHIGEQMDKFNEMLEREIRDIPVTLLGGESAVLKKGRFVLRDISDERQEVAKITGIVSEVLFFEGVVYDKEARSWMKVEDYQIRKAEFPKVRDRKK